MSNEIRLFALLIGINDYKISFGDRPLRGAVPDTLRFQSYLEKHIGVPSNQINVLINEKATRNNIINALKSFRNDKRIDKGDAIFMYYAGHGTQIDPPKERRGATLQQIQAIVPYDCDSEVEGGKSETRVPPIPDYMLEILLSKIVEEKGDNITVIFDCCHSASATRGQKQDADVISRSVHIEKSDVYTEQLSRELLAEETISRDAFVASKFKHRGLGSHILLSACGALEEAKEINGHGRFSTAILNLLEQVEFDSLRYSDILKHEKIEKIEGQNPQCEGRNLHRTLFDAKVLPIQKKAFDISFDDKANNGLGKYIVHGGTIHNIKENSEFSIYRKADLSFSTPKGTLEVDKIQSYSFTAKLPSNVTAIDLHEPMVAVQTKWGKQGRLNIYIDPGTPFWKTYDDMSKTPDLKLKSLFDTVVVVDKSDEAFVKIETNAENALKFTMSVPLMIPGQMMMEHVINNVDADANNLALTLSKVAHFYRELRYIKTSLPVSDSDTHVPLDDEKKPKISERISVEFYKLQENSDADEDTEYDEEILSPVGSNLCTGGIVDLVIADEDEENIPYGIKIVNNSKLGLYANVFHFNTHDLEIYCVAAAHIGHTVRGPDVPLRPRGGSLDIGFGSAGYHPLCFKVANGLDIDIGFLKIYLSTHSVSLGYIPQSSPFSSETTRARKDYESKGKQAWTNIVVPIILRRHPVDLEQK
ncbi:hypothetical protein BDN70DRAFT_878993 [Pholiota conissans]|uniref:Peptidase C14 caspase domain-containing protein n=1 Tax=Pholiota conissans TaxID=109636 RepID=A0A9P6CU61_9AGAR|nr:hypothetical protein BDN70DRAFT_878993 [Pholiota conissans]